MEIRLSAGDKIQIPTGCKATIEDDLIVIKEKQDDFKDGDILKCIESDNMVVFKNQYKHTLAFRIYFSLIGESRRICLYSKFRRATEGERQAFFDELKAKGLKWNEETKQMERIRKRAKEGETFLFINSCCEVRETVEAGPPPRR